MNDVEPGASRVLVTGASGFVGSSLVPRLRSRAWHISAITRGTDAPPGADHVFTRSDPWHEAALRSAMDGMHAVVHCAARVHVMKDSAADPLAAFRRTNVDGTMALARAAAAAGVGRFVFLSSVKVNGEASVPGSPCRETDHPAPEDPYAQSKLEAEQGLRDLARSTAMAVTILRLPLVHGPGVRANFRALIAAVRRGVPLPLGAVTNRRSLIGLDNLTDVIACCLRHPRAVNETFLVSDGEDLSTPDLIRRLARAMGRPPRLVPVPVPLLATGAALLGQRDKLERLTGTLQVDITKVRTLLDWSPPCPVDEGLRRTVAARSGP